MVKYHEQNRRRRERNAYRNLVAYAQEHGLPDAEAAAARAASEIHGEGVTAPALSRRRARTAEKVPHRLEQRTKEQLYERAQELDVEGRSTMTKAELITAIRAKQ